jgi:hypothetical protein
MVVFFSEPRAADDAIVPRALKWMDFKSVGIVWKDGLYINRIRA